MSEASCFFYVFLFPEIFVVHSSSFPIIHFRAFPNNSVLLPFRFPAHFFRIFHHFRKHVRRFLFFIFHHFRKFPSFIFHHLRVIVHFRKNPSCFQFVSQSIISACFLLLFECSVFSGNFRHSYSFPFHFRIIPSFIFHHFRIIVHFRNIPSCFHLASQSIIAGCPKFSVLYCLRKFPSFISHHFRFISDYSVVIFPEISGIISSIPLHFRMIPSSYFRNFPSFIFHHVRFISPLFVVHIS